MRVVNLTEHNINVLAHGEPYVTLHRIPPSGEVARVQEYKVTEYNILDVPLYSKSFGEVTGVPKPEPGKLFIVSSRVAECLRGKRFDLIVPDGLVRSKETGSIIGCQSFWFGGNTESE